MPDTSATGPHADLPGGVSDQALVARALAGDEQGFAVLYERYAPKMLVRLRRILGRSDEAEDVLQMLFLQVHRKLASYDPARPFGAWLHGFAFNIATRHLRAQRRRWWLGLGRDRAFDDAAPKSAPHTPEHEAMDQQLARRLYDAMQHLAPVKRIAFTLHEVEGLGLTEIGELTGASPQTVRARVLSARRDIQARLGATSRGTRTAVETKA